VKYLHYCLIIITFLNPAVLSGEELTHLVGKGDTIYSISRLYQVSPDELMKANGINDPSKLQLGKLLKIPPSVFVKTPGTAPVQNYTDYIVNKGDTLFGIAKNYNISLQTLLDINKFNSNHVIKPGDIIKLPANTKKPEPPSGLRWPVTAKDILYMTGQMGVIIQGEYFEPVKSLTQGKVISAGPWRKFGQVVIVEASGGYLYMYGGCESLSVKVGDKITAGLEVGKLGINSGSEKPQLFFMVFKSNTPIDPVKAPRASESVKT
jgi:LysM repeat protein